MNTPEMLALYCEFRAYEAAKQRQEERRRTLAETVIAAVLAVLVGILAT